VTGPTVSPLEPLKTETFSSWTPIRLQHRGESTEMVRPEGPKSDAWRPERGRSSWGADVPLSTSYRGTWERCKLLYGSGAKPRRPGDL